MSQAKQQVKIPETTKRELAVFSALKGRSQGELVAEAWAEYRERHGHELSEELRWAQSVLADPGRASVEASGMDQADLDGLRDAFGD
jgi:hypothetical protein